MRHRIYASMHPPPIRTVSVSEARTVTVVAVSDSRKEHKLKKEKRSES